MVRDSDSDEPEGNAEHSTTRNHNHRRPANLSLERNSGYSSSGSAQGGAPSEDWSVISEQDERLSSSSSRHSEGKPSVERSGSKRNSLAAAVMSVLPDTFPGSPRRRTISSTSHS